MSNEKIKIITIKCLVSQTAANNNNNKINQGIKIGVKLI